jgi:hypothetical protein
MRVHVVVTAAALLLGVAPPSQSAEVVAPSSVPVIQSVVTLPAGVDTILGSALNRRYLCLMNIGAGLVTLGFDQAAVAGTGWAMEGASGAGHQGGAMCWESAIVAASAVHGISAAGSTVVVLEGR